MGLFGKISKFFNNSLGFDPTFGTAATIEDWINDPTGAKAASKEQADALRAAGRIEEAQRMEAKALRNQIIAESAPFREQAQVDLKRLQGQTPGSTEFYKQGIERGSESIAEQRNKYGLVSSGGTERQFGDLTSNILLQEELYRQQGIGQAAQLSQAGYGYGLDALQQEGGAAYRQAQSIAAAAAAKAQGKLSNRGFWTGLATQAGGMALGSYLAGGAGAAAGGAAGGASGGYSGGYNLEQGTGYNQFLNPYG